MIEIGRITPDFLAKHPELLVTRQVYEPHEYLPALRQRIVELDQRSDIDHILGDASEDYIQWCIQPLLLQQNVENIFSTEHNSTLDQLGIDIVVLYKNEPPTLAQVATTGRKARHKARRIANRVPDKILVVSAFQSHTSLTPSEFVLGVFVEWRYNPRAAQQKVLDRLRNPPMDYSHPPHKAVET